MKPKLLFSIILLLIIIGLAIYGYFKATPGVEDQTEARPRIEITPHSFDFGEVEYGKIVEYTFKVKNSGNQTLEIKKVATSCACATATIEKERLNVGEEVSLFVEYDTGAMSGSRARGQQERIIYVKSNDPLSPQTEVLIYAYIK